MPLQLIHGPPNTGRTEMVRRAYLDLIDRNPVLVVPGVDDIFTWQRRLAGESGALLGGRILHFKDLADEILRRAGAELPPVAGDLRRRRFAARAIAAAWPDLAPRLRFQPGLPASALDLIDDFRSNLRDPGTIEQQAADSGTPHLRRVAGVYRQYLSKLEAAGLSDRPERQFRAAKTDLSAWAGTPLFVTGFDDLTAQQIELLIRFSDHTDVTVVLTHELENPAMALTATLFSALVEAGATVASETWRDDEPADHDRDLFEAEKRFLRPDPGEKLAPGGAIRLLTSSGRRNEAEAVAAEIAKLIDGGVPPGEIAVAIDSPSIEGPLFRDVLNSYRVPVTLEGELRVASTATGQAILGLLAATGPSGTSSDLLRILRGPAGPEPEQVDRLERLILRERIDSAADAMKLLADRGMDPPGGWDELVDAADDGIAICGILGDLALEIGSAVLRRDPQAIPADLTLVETRAASAIRGACEELSSAALEGLDRDAVREAIASDAVSIWAVPSEGTARIASPYALRAKRVRHLFYVSLQEGGIIDGDRSGPFLSASDRNALALPDYSDPELQSRYLFYSMMTVPTDGLWLSCRIADETGKAEYPSPHIGAVEALFEGSQINAEGANHGRSGSDLTYGPGSAPSLDEFARTVAAGAPDDASGALAELEAEPSDEVGRRVEVARETEARTRRLASLSSDFVLERLAAKEMFSATRVEAYSGCRYRWFIERQLRPLPLGPDPEYFAFGNLLHRTLAKLYSEGGGNLPRRETLDGWMDKVPPEVERQAGELGLGTHSPQHRANRSHARSLISGYLRREAEREGPKFRPLHLEVGFGLDDATPGVDMGSWQLIGRVDRIDESEDGESGLVIDYKTGSSSTLSLADIRRQGKLQLQLYMHAIREVGQFGLRPVAGFYVPMRSSDRPRGIYDGGQAALVKDLRPYGTDAPKPEKEAGGDDTADPFDTEIEKAVARAGDLVAQMRAGLLEHDPATCPDHLDHPAVPDRQIDEEEPGKVTVR